MKREEDKQTDYQLNQYVSLDNSQSFFLMAGAGSGKTRSLVSMLDYLRNEWKENLEISGRKIAVITFTKAASEEISARIRYDSSFHISTIHSFAWEMIKYFQYDIKEYLIDYYKGELFEFSKRKESASQKLKVDKYTKKIKDLTEVNKFNYSPDTQVRGTGYLTHSEVIQIMTKFLQSNSSFVRIMVQKFPVLLIDECQDTNKNLLISLINIEKNYDNFCLGLIGDMMQRVYTGGLEDLQKRISHWGNTPQKEMNWRCQKRIVEFLNVLREQTDQLQQYQNKDKNEGIIKAYIVQERDNDQQQFNLENKISDHFKNNIDYKEDITTLILEHKMASRRNGFSNMYIALNKNDTKNALKDGTGREMKFVKELVLPLMKALRSPEEFEILKILRKEKVFDRIDINQRVVDLKKKINEIRAKINEKITLREAINYINELEITKLPNSFLFPDEQDLTSMNWQEAMDETLEEFENYFTYKDEQSPYITQQGSKGLEYNHVMVIMNDKESVGKLFSYGKISGATPPTTTDLKNIKEGKDNSIERTRRLLYVAASRAKESLGLVIYSTDVEKTIEYYQNKDLIKDCEIVVEADL